MTENSTSFHHKELQQHHNKVCWIYENAVTIDVTLKNKLIDTVEDTYTKGLKNKYTTFSGITFQKLLEKLIDRCGKITIVDLETNNNQINEPIKSSFPIGKYFEQVNECFQYTYKIKAYYTTEKLLHKVQHEVIESVLYTNVCKYHRKNDMCNQKWINFEKFFADNYHDLNLIQKLNMGKAGYQCSNAIIPT